MNDLSINRSLNNSFTLLMNQQQEIPGIIRPQFVNNFDHALRNEKSAEKLQFYNRDPRNEEVSDKDLLSNLNKYEKLRISFEKSKVVHQKLRAIKRLYMHYSIEKDKLSQLPLYKQMLCISNLLMLNEVEIAYWQILNQQIVITEVKKKLFLQRMMMTALLSKKIANDEQTIQIFYSFLRHNYPKFMESFKYWELRQGNFENMLTVEKISAHFNALFGNPIKGSTFFKSDIETDFNYIVDSLEDEHERRAVHTTKAPKHRQITEQYSEHYNKSLRTHQDFINIDSRGAFSRSRSRSPSESNIRYVTQPIKRGRPSKKDIEIKEQQQQRGQIYMNHNSKQYNQENSKKQEIIRQDQNNAIKKEIIQFSEQQKFQQPLQQQQQQFAQIANKSTGNPSTIQNFNSRYQMNGKDGSPILRSTSNQLKNIEINLPNFNSSMYNAESFGNLPPKSSLNDLLVKKTIEQNSSREVVSVQKKNTDIQKDSSAFNHSIAEIFGKFKPEKFDEDDLTKNLIEQKQDQQQSTFSSSVASFIQPNKIQSSLPQAQKQISFQRVTSISNLQPDNPFMQNQNAFELPDLINEQNKDKNNFPSFYAQKSASFDTIPTDTSNSYQSAKNGFAINRNMKADLENIEKKKNKEIQLIQNQ